MENWLKRLAVSQLSPCTQAAYAAQALTPEIASSVTEPTVAIGVVVSWKSRHVKPMTSKLSTAIVTARSRRKFCDTLATDFFGRLYRRLSVPLHFRSVRLPNRLLYRISRCDAGPFTDGLIALNSEADFVGVTHRAVGGVGAARWRRPARIWRTSVGSFRS